MGLFYFLKSASRKSYHIPSGMSAKDYAQSILDNLQFHADEINCASDVFGFSYSYQKLAENIDILIWLNEKKKVFMSPPPRDDWTRVQRNLGITIDDFFDRVLKYCPLNADAKAAFLEDFVDEVSNDSTFSSILSPENKLRLDQMKDEAAAIRSRLAEEAERKDQLDRLNGLGLRSNIDASDLDPFAVADKLEQRLKMLYQYCLSRGLSPQECRNTYSSFKDNCASSALPLAAEIRLEDLLAQYEPRFTEDNPIHAIDSMDGGSFELWCAALLQKLGFTKVQVTKGSGDDGVDVLAEKEGIRYAVQCKCYSSNLGKGPIQEVNAGRTMPKYRCQIGVVMTNRYFTKGAIELAEANGVLLWDRDWIIRAIQSTK